MLYFMLLDFFPTAAGGRLLPPYFGLVSLILATPVQFIIGAGFYRGMWSSLRMKTFNMDSLIAIGTSHGVHLQPGQLCQPRARAPARCWGIGGAKIARPVL